MISTAVTQQHIDTAPAAVAAVSGVPARALLNRSLLGLLGLLLPVGPAN